MAFPTTGILDAFTGSDTDPAPGWDITRPSANARNIRRVSNQAGRSESGTASAAQACYTAEEFGPDVEVYATVATLPSSGQSVSVTCNIRTTAIGTTLTDYYQGTWTNGTGWRLFRVIDNGYQQVGSTVGSPAMSAGDGIGLERIGTALRLLHRSGGVWSEIMEETHSDAMIPNTGYIGVEIIESTARLDDFGGGDVVVSTTTPRLVRVPIIIPSVAVQDRSRW